MPPLFNEWKNSLSDKKLHRLYRHLDSDLDIRNQFHEDIVLAALINASKHQYLPFIKRVDVTNKYKKDASGRAQRKSKLRPIMYAGHLDAFLYSYYGYILSQSYEAIAGASSIAYRTILGLNGRGKSNVDFAKEAFDEISKRKTCSVLITDISSFFDNLNHGIVFDSVRRLMGATKLEAGLYKCLESLTKYRFIHYDDFNEKGLAYSPNRRAPVYRRVKGLYFQNTATIGIPQGSPMSGLLANIYMLEFDSLLVGKFPGIYYRRYSDDMIIVCDAGREAEIYEALKSKMSEIGLSLSETKTRFAAVEEIEKKAIVSYVSDCHHTRLGAKYVDYLGFEYYSEGHIIYRKTTLSRLRRKSLFSVGQSKRSKKGGGKTRFVQGERRRFDLYHQRAAKIFNSKQMNRQTLKIRKDVNKKKASMKNGGE